MSDYSILVTRSDGRRHPVHSTDRALSAISLQAFRFAQNAAIHGCPLGDALPPKWVDILDPDGIRLLRIVVDESLIPPPEYGK